MKETRPPLEIARPCSMDWSTMTGDARKRFCEGCQKHVFNLSAMTEKEAREFAEETQGRECIAYVPTVDGRIHTPNRIERGLLWLSGRIPRMAALFTLVLPATLAASVERTLGKPAPPRKDPPVRDGGEKAVPKNPIVPGTPAVPRNPVKPGQTAKPPAKQVEPPALMLGDACIPDPPPPPPPATKGGTVPKK